MTTGARVKRFFFDPLAWTGALFSLGVGIVVSMTPFGGILERYSYDIPFLFRSNSTPEDVIIIYLDERSHEALNQPFDQIWDRRLHAELLDKLTECGARIVFFDIVFVGPSSSPESDTAFARALRRNQRTVLAAGLSEAMESPTRVDLISVQLPYDPFFEASYKVGLAVFEPLDNDFGIRRLTLGNELMFFAPYEVASELNPDLEAQLARRSGERWINYHGPSGTFHSVSFHEAYLNDSIDETVFQDKIVFIGARYEVGFSGTGKDTFRSPYSLQDKRYFDGVEVHANMMQNLRDGDWLQRADPLNEYLLYALISVVVCLILARLDPLHAILTTVLIVAAMFVGSIVHQWSTLSFYNWLLPVTVQVPTAFAWAVGIRFGVERRKRERYRRAFGLYVSEDLARDVAETGFSLEPGGKIEEVTLMFTDMENFTGLTEHTDPKDLSTFLTTYFTRATEAFWDERGTLIKYAGDGIFALWGQPIPFEDHATRAVRAGVEMIRQTQTQSVLLTAVRSRIGIHTARCLVGNLGTPRRFDYTAIGAEVNAASRLEGLNKYLGTSILISQVTYDQLHRSEFSVRKMGSYVMKGKQDPFTVYEVYGYRGFVVNPRSEEYIRAYEEGRVAFSRGHWDEAEDAFRRADRLYPGDIGDPASQLYLSSMAQMRQIDALPRGWVGQVYLTDK